MTISLNEFIKKYELDVLNKSLELKGLNKAEFLNDLKIIMQSISKLFDSLASTSFKNEGLLLLGLAKLQKKDAVILKSDIKNCLLIERYDALTNSFEKLEKQNYIKIKEIRANIHQVKLNEEDNPNFKIFREIVQNYWESPEEQKNRVKKWEELE